MLELKNKETNLYDSGIKGTLYKNNLIISKAIKISYNFFGDKYL